jgi:two-component system alkaline phosphatase synthesis response regulator PhoP
VTNEREKILLIDDDPFVLDHAKEILEQNGYDCILAINGFQGIKMANEILPRLIFLDLEMPLMDGYKVLKTLKDSPRTEGIPVVLLTAQDLNVDRGKGFDLGATMYINKPFTSIKMMSIVNVVLNKHISFDGKIEDQDQVQRGTSE